MNNELSKRLRLSIPFSGTLEISPEILQQLLLEARPGPACRCDFGIPESDRLAYTVQETADLLGVSVTTVYRLMRRGLLRCSKALRTKIIAKTEIERFLKNTIDT